MKPLHDPPSPVVAPPSYVVVGEHLLVLPGEWLAAGGIRAGRSTLDNAVEARSEHPLARAILTAVPNPATASTTPRRLGPPAVPYTARELATAALMPLSGAAT